MTRGDRILVAALAALALLLVPLTLAHGAESARDVIIEAPDGTSVVPLGDDAELRIEGRVGVVEVVVRDGGVRVEEADCPDSVCVHTGTIDSPGSVIACVPNGVVVRIGGGGASGVDTVIR